MSSVVISIIVPIYNTEKYISRCVESILSQTYTDFELLLIDDGSNDKSGDLCDEYAHLDSRVVVFHKENGGVSSTRNVGLENAHGEWITFVDADDWLNPTALEQYLDAVKDGKADIIRAGYCKCFSDGTTEEISCQMQFDVTDKAEMLNQIERTVYYGFLWNSFFRRDIIGSVRFDEDISWCEDHLFSLLCYKKSRLVRFSPFIAYNYRINLTGSLSFPKDPIMITDVADKEIKTKFSLYGSEANATCEAWHIYYGKLAKAICIAAARGYRSFREYYKYSRAVFIRSLQFPTSRFLSFFYNPYIPGLAKFVLVKFYSRRMLA